MLTPKQIDDYPARLIEIYSEAERSIIADMAQRIAAGNGLGTGRY